MRYIYKIRERERERERELRGNFLQVRLDDKPGWWRSQFDSLKYNKRNAASVTPKKNLTPLGVELATPCLQVNPVSPLYYQRYFMMTGGMTLNYILVTRQLSPRWSQHQQLPPSRSALPSRSISLSLEIAPPKAKHGSLAIARGQTFLCSL